MPKLTGADALIQSLIPHGVDTIFGIPGFQTYELFDSLARTQPPLDLYVTRHEQGAGYMAFGYARSTGRLGVFTVVPGPGVLNAASAICTAQSTSTPLLCLVGQIPSFSIGKQWGMLHELPDQLATLKTLSKHAVRIERVADTATVINEAIALATGGKPGVVVVEMAMDVMAATEDRALVFREVAAAAVEKPAQFSARDIKKAATLLQAAKNPMIFAGAAAVDVAREIKDLAGYFQIPIVTVQNTQGLIDARDPLAFNLPQGYDYWDKVDLVIGISSRLEFPSLHWGRWAGKKLIRIDADKDALVRHRVPDVAFCGTGAAVLPGLFAAARKDRPATASRAAEFDAHKKRVARTYADIQPQMAYLDAIRAALPEDGFFVDELTQVGYASWYGFPGYLPRHFISSGYQGNLGYGYAAALGVKAANPKAAVVSIAGDGGFLYNVQELATAAKYNLGVVGIVFNNHAFGNVKSDQERLFAGRRIGVDLRNPDFVRLAEDFGISAEHVDGPAALRKALVDAFARNKPHLIEVPLGSGSSPWGPIYPRGSCAAYGEEC